ncbi:hypothetical protein U1Q18_025138, partial [Sarracenia purpurea var. burkii]
MHPWTLIGLVGAFLDLSIAYLLLCASTLAFITSKFLGFFGFCLPCPCNGLDGTPYGNYCLHRLLVDYPMDRVSSVHLSVKSRFPFDSICGKDQDYQLNLKLIKNRNNLVDGFFEIEGEASRSSIAGAKKSQNVVEKDLVLRNESIRWPDAANNSSFEVKDGRFDLKGKGIVNQRPKSSLRRRRKGLTEYAKKSSVLLSDPSCADARSPSIMNRNENKATECISLPVDTEPHANHFNDDDEDPILKNSGQTPSQGLDDEEDPILSNSGERASQGFEFTEPLHEYEFSNIAESSFDEIKFNVKKVMDCEGNEKNAIKILEQALEEEHAALAAIYLDLEKERSAAATAADEAMAMILRLQEEKASIEMEARQYQRMIEEKSAYDAEEMNILKEILVRREREKHVLEKEVEVYRQMIGIGNPHIHDDIQDMVKREQLATSLDLSEDPVLMLQQLNESIDKKEIVKYKSSVNEASSIEKQNCTSAVEEELQISGWDEEADFLKQGDLDKQCSHISSTCQELNFSEETIETHDVTDKLIRYDSENLEQPGKEAYEGSKNSVNKILDMEPNVHDVHVVEGNRNEWILQNNTSNVHRDYDLPLNASEIQRIEVKTDCPSTSGLDTKLDLSRSSTRITAWLPSRHGSSGKSILSELRRNSMSAVDNERLKIDTEVGWLRERLRIVQEGREKLNFPMEHRDRENCQLQLLEDIACQLREIRQFTEPSNAMRQGSLPLPSSK